MNWADNINTLVAAVIAALMGVIGFLVRKVLTNDTRISMLETEIEQREESRREYNDLIQTQLGEIRNDIKNLLSRA